MASIFRPRADLVVLSAPYLIMVMVEDKFLFLATFRGRPLRFGVVGFVDSVIFGGLDTSLPVLVTLICFFGVTLTVPLSVFSSTVLPALIACSLAFGGVVGRE